MMIDSWDPLMGGAQVHIKQLAERLINDYGIEVHLVTRDLKGGRKRPKIEKLLDGKFIVHRVGIRTKFENIPARLWWCLRAGFYSRKLHLKEHFDLIHAHAFLSSYPARFARFLCGLPIVYTVHGTSLFHKKTGLQAGLERQLLTKMKYDRQITVAENFLDLKNINKRITVIPNGIDVSEFDKVKVEKPDDGIFRVLYVGRFDAIKGLDDLIRGVYELSKEGIKKELQVRLVGYGYEIKKLRKLMRDLHLTRVVKFVGRKEGDELIEEFKRADVFVLPSHSEGQSLTLMEAAACGLPILATQVGDNGKLVKEDVNGYLIPPGHPQEIKHYLNRFIGNPHLQQMGEESRAILDAAEMTWENAAKKTYSLYRRVLMDLKGVPFRKKLWDLLAEVRLPHHSIRQTLRHFKMSRITTKRMRITEPVLCSLTVDVERNLGSHNEDGDLEPTLATCRKFFENFKGFCDQQELKSTLFTQGNLVPDLAAVLKKFDENGHEIGLHGMYHGLWGKAKWFLNDRPLTKAEKMEFLDRAIKSFEDAELTRPRSFRAPNMAIDRRTFEVFEQFGIKYDSSFSSYRGEDFGKRYSLPYEIAGVKGLPVSFDPLPHFRLRFGLPVANYWVMNLYYLLKLPEAELEEAVRRIIWSQKKARVKPHLVFLLHSWEFETGEEDYCGGDNYSNLAQRLYILNEKFGLKFLTFENLCKEICT